mgnify:CR=1 FL=1
MFFDTTKNKFKMPIEFKNIKMCMIKKNDGRGALLCGRGRHRGGYRGRKSNGRGHGRGVGRGVEEIAIEGGIEGSKSNGRGHGRGVEEVMDEVWKRSL